MPIKVVGKREPEGYCILILGEYRWECCVGKVQADL